MDSDIQLLHPNAWRLTYGDADGAIPNGGVVPGWEPGLDIRARTTVQLKQSAEKSLGPDARQMRLVVFAIARTSQGLHTIKSLKAPLDLEGGETTIELLLDGHSIAKDLSLHLGIASVESSPSNDRLSPRDVGARLWSADWRARVEGGKARLAMDAVDFAQYFADPRFSGGLIHVIVSEDPATDVEQGLTVLLNAAQEGFVSAISRREPHATAILRDTVIRRVIVIGAEHEYSLKESYPEGSIGEQWKMWLKHAFPRKSPEEVLEHHRVDASTFEARIQSWTNMGGAFSSEVSK